MFAAEPFRFTSPQQIISRPDGMFELLLNGVLMTKADGSGLTYEEAEAWLDEIEQRCQRKLATLN